MGRVTIWSISVRWGFSPDNQQGIVNFIGALRPATWVERTELHPTRATPVTSAQVRTEYLLYPGLASERTQNASVM
jgi:hypothetical protein